jgi:hypothetical protein
MAATKALLDMPRRRAAASIRRSSRSSRDRSTFAIGYQDIRAGECPQDHDALAEDAAQEAERRVVQHDDLDPGQAGSFFD